MPEVVPPDSVALLFEVEGLAVAGPVPSGRVLRPCAAATAGAVATATGVAPGAEEMGGVMTVALTEGHSVRGPEVERLGGAVRTLHRGGDALGFLGYGWSGFRFGRGGGIRNASKALLVLPLAEVVVGLST